MKKKEKDNFNWDSISIQKYYDIMDILDSEDDDITKNVKMVALVMDKYEDEVWNMGLPEVGGYIGKLMFLNKFDVPKSPNMKMVLPDYKITVMKDVTNINIAQYVDFQHFATLPMRDGIDKILSIFLIPEGKTYNNGYDILDLQKQLRENLSFRMAQGLLAFFLKRSAKLLIRSVTCCEKMMKREKNQEKLQELQERKEMAARSLQSLIHLIGSYSSRGLVTAQN